MSVEALLQPLQFPFMQNAYLAALLISPGAAMLSCFLVLKGWALLGDAASHATMPGVVIAYLLGLPYGLGGFLAAMACALSVGFLASNSRIKADTAMGIVFSGMFALGLVIHAWTGSSIHLDHILFGNMLGIDRQELLTSGLIGLGVAAVLALKWRDLLLFSFDPIQARASGLRTGWLHYGLLVMLAGVIVAMLASVGLILAVGLLIAPGAIAFLLARRFAAMMAVAVAVCLAATLGGVHASFYLDSAPAPTIVLILTAMFLAAFARRMVVTRRASRA
ncbi:metal ABC transporter permease [Paracoccus suum]|uniref:Metal ABC transporter permease n=1 Tax=Paracoccus suum TaxID=2259340 RepID=A0A344PKT0_9RHOB|nr:metal ABC transporter permease [Paracoccus suum]AXC49985.1 metal ABC transporter permease [Paracoccus suum]